MGGRSIRVTHNPELLNRPGFAQPPPAPPQNNTPPTPVPPQQHHPPEQRTGHPALLLLLMYRQRPRGTTAGNNIRGTRFCGRKDKCKKLLLAWGSCFCSFPVVVVGYDIDVNVRRSTCRVNWFLQHILHSRYLSYRCGRCLYWFYSTSCTRSAFRVGVADVSCMREG